MAGMKEKNREACRGGGTTHFTPTGAKWVNLRLSAMLASALALCSLSRRPGVQQG
jgi:hypothetical protein